MNIALTEWDNLIGSLYETILRPGDLKNVLKAGNLLLESDLCHLFGFTHLGEESFRVITQDEYEPTVAAYASYFGGIDPRRSRLDQSRPGGIYRCSEICDSAFVRRNEFYQDYYLPHGLRYVLGSCVMRDNHHSVYVSYNHKLGREDFSDSEKEIFGRFIGHLSRVVHGIVKTGSIHEALNAGEEYLYRHQQGIIGLDDCGRVTFANNVAESVLLPLRSTFCNSRLVASCQLDVAFKSLLATGQPTNCAIPNGAATFYVSMFPFRNEAEGEGQAELSLRTKTRVIVCFGDGRPRSRSALALTEWFGFTPAEARLARALAAGSHVEEFARSNGVSVATVRTQLRNVLQKSGTTRQQDLISLLQTLPR